MSTVETAKRPLRRFTGRSLAGLIVVLATGVGFGVLLALVRLKWQPMEGVDHGVARDLNLVVAHDRPLLAVLRTVTSLGSHTVLFPLVGVAAVSLLIRRRIRLAVYLAVTGLGALILDPALKTVVGRVRPVVADPVAYGPGNSFPSGHALGSLVSYGALLLVFLPALPRRARRPVTALVALLVLAIGFSRIALGVHYVSDVVGGWLLGVAWLGVTGYAFQMWRRETGRPTTEPLSEGLEPEAAPDLKVEHPEGGHSRPLHPIAATSVLVVGWVFVFGLVTGLGELIDRYGHGQGDLLGDSTVPHWLAAHRTATLNQVTFWFSEAGNTHLIIGVGLAAAALALAWIRRWRPVVFLFVLMAGEVTLFVSAVAIVSRPRPDVPHLENHLPTSSYPSGHVAATICLYTGIALLVFPRTRAWWRWLTVVAAVLMPLLVAAARLYRGMHHPTDLLGSVLLAACWVPLVYRVVQPCADEPAELRWAVRLGRWYRQRRATGAVASANE
ncbi:MAG TPA: phosphatase PAP2 family protein [Micromonosporaceae bacterium]